MIEETISKIEQRLRDAESLDPAQRSELERLIAELRREADSLPEDSLPASDGNEDLESSVSRLAETLAAFETSHPQLTGAVNRISVILANMGI